MLEYDKIDISEAIDTNKTNALKDVIFVIIGILKILVLSMRPYLCKGCHDLMQKALNFNDFAIVSDKGSNYRIHFWYMSKDDAINIMKNSKLNEKKWVITDFFIICI